MSIDREDATSKVILSSKESANLLEYLGTMGPLEGVRDLGHHGAQRRDRQPLRVLGDAGRDASERLVGHVDVRAERLLEEPPVLGFGDKFRGVVSALVADNGGEDRALRPSPSLTCPGRSLRERPPPRA